MSVRKVKFSPTVRDRSKGSERSSSSPEPKTLINTRLRGKARDAPRTPRAQGRESLTGIRFRAYLIGSLWQMQEQMQQLTRLAKAYFRFASPGRRRHEKVTRAAGMRAEGQTWPRIYRTCLPHHDSYTSEDAYKNAQRSLRNAVGNRQRRATQSPSAEEAKPAPATN